MWSLYWTYCTQFSLNNSLRCVILALHETFQMSIYPIASYLFEKSTNVATLSQVRQRHFISISTVEPEWRSTRVMINDNDYQVIMVAIDDQFLRVTSNYD